MKAGLFFPPFGPAADPRVCAGLAARAEEHGWDGVFLWDHLQYRAPATDVGDPWIAMAAQAVATERVRLGAMVTPLARRRPAVVARQVTALDQLSGGRMTVGVGLGLDRSGRELSSFGEELDDRTRAAMLAEALELLDGLWSGEPVDHQGEHYTAADVHFLPPPVQRPRPPIWVGARWPNRRPIARALRHDGIFPVDIGGPQDLADLVGHLGEAGAGPDFDVAVMGATVSPDEARANGATWWLTWFGHDFSDVADIEAVIANGAPT
ncbi:MAG: LLM class flavin-dependent oxidoreductase [Acidimicrobiales bacterium]